jgi:hypothetical protein
VPVPLQRPRGISVDPVHDGGSPQVVVEGALAQAPAPLQKPVLPHGGAAAQAASVAVLGRLVQVPGLLAKLQFWQVPQLALPQQTPSVQKPVMHSVPAMQAVPAGFKVVQDPLWQVYCGPAQGVVAEQVVAHCVAVLQE